MKPAIVHALRAASPAPGASCSALRCALPRYAIAFILGVSCPAFAAPLEEPIKPLPLDRHRVLQILVNLISNAKQAMDAVAAPTHRLTLRADLADGADGRGLRVSVADEGEGIAAENLARIFNHGFTTRQNGHGFGLHSCVLAAQEMGGSLTAHSDGPGRGATFTLLIPMNGAQS